MITTGSGEYCNKDLKTSSPDATVGDTQARFEALYEDHKARATRREAEWQKRLQGDVSLRMAQSVLH